MADIFIERQHDFSQQDAMQRIIAIEEKLQNKFGIKLNWSDNRAAIKGSGVSGDITVRKDSITLQLNLNFMLKPLKGKIEEAINRSVDKALS